MKISELVRKVDYHFNDLKGQAITDPEQIRRIGQVEVSAIVNDNRKVTQGALFFCIVGARFDGHDYALQALENGAAAVVVQKDLDLSGYHGDHEPVVIRVEDTRYAMAFISAAWYGNPASQLKVIGVTGTKGKTTTTYMVRSILMAAGYKVGLIGTIETLYNDVRIPAHNTTPESMALQATFRDMVDAGIEVVVMEVSSQALMLHRTQGFIFDLGIFTNISPDHIGPAEHKSFEEYMHCKGLLFQQCRVGIVNGDDPKWQQVLEDHTCQVETFGTKKTDDLYADGQKLIDKPGELGVEFDVHGLLSLHAEVPMPGSFTVYNALCAIAICRHFNVPVEDIVSALKQVKVKGRIEMEKVSDDFTLLIDYAHNAMALRSLLTTLREYHPARLVTLFGCGGNRSRERRFEMGEVSGELSDLTIITSDNPRDEDPLDIIADIKVGMAKTSGKYIEIPDRREAIAWAIHNGQKGDIIILAGKGHEDYQEIKGKRYPMDERVIIREILEADRKKG